MNTKIILSALVLSLGAAPAFAQSTTVVAPAGTEVAVVSPTPTAVGVAVNPGAIGTAVPVTGFTPVAGAALAAAGPLALGLGAIIAVGAISGGGSSSGTNGTN
ncbi:hypothetical protein FHS72_000835 [Loktanella ponticola]|uniref:Uncharacterized protein n=1 Tax=Yoonia ponticola TaxID=1524255 RepID=A0A7W9BIL7_9RHOB|nr:hypothetical protein [Yoonia ponticola]MBB5721228.1 hypothetical protein [Yoonia ponticola]